MKEKIITILAAHTSLSKEQIDSLIEVPKDSKLGDFAFPCFQLAKSEKKNPAEISKTLASKIMAKEFEKVEAVGPYLNFFVNRNLFAKKILETIFKEKECFGSTNKGEKKNVVIDLSSPNIAKPFGIGHLRSTIIGNSIAQLAMFQGFTPIKINYLGDWGTQFGKLIVGYSLWGDEKKLKKEPIKHLQELYVKVNQDESLEQRSRDAFKSLEEGNEETITLWKKFKALSLKEFERLYKILNIDFDVFSGESYYNDKMDKVVQLLKDKSLLKEDQDAQIIDLEQYGLGVCLIKKSDGATLYATRDLAAAIDRYKKYEFASMIYEVGSEQTLHFKQIFKVLSLAGFDWAKDCIHVAHGLYLDQDGKKFATRKGKTVLMEEVIDETIELAKKEILNREPNLAKTELEKRARSIAISAIFYGDLKNHRANDLVFDIEKFLSFEGDTGPYLLYTYARAKSILKKAKYKRTSKITPLTIDEKEKKLIVALSQFPQIASKAYETFSPNLVANYVFTLAQDFNEFYHKDQVVGSETQAFRLALVDATSIVIKRALGLLGISVLEKM